MAEAKLERQTVRPIRVARIDDLVGALPNEGIELGVTPSLTAMQEQVPASSVHFSMTRMRNATY